jgi:TRAP-type C4-dicarboxylate transport system permease small subunit
MWFAFGVFLTWQSVLLEVSFWDNLYESPALGIDQKWPYLCLVFGFGLMTIRLVQIYYRWWKFDESILEERVEETGAGTETPHV